MDLFEKTLETKRIYEGRVINLRIDTVQLPDGNTSTREIIEHKGAVAIVPMIDHENIVLVKQFRQSAGRVLLEIPAGGLELGEEPADCARRELTEEIGYYPNKLTEMFYSYLAPGYSTEKLHTFLAEDLESSSAGSDTDEFLEVVTVKLPDAIDMIRSGEIADAKSICGILLASRLFKEC
ncbi:MAG: NUDIX domain-containing protein [Armatimonadota bacterium]